MSRHTLTAPLWRVPRFTAWGARAALAALLAMALLPTLSHALRSPTGAGWTELCTVGGSKWVRVTDDPRGALPVSNPLAGLTSDAPPGPEQSAPAFDHCPYCSLQTQPLGPAPAPAVFVALALELAAPCGRCTRQRGVPAWLAARPRGPPRIA